MASALQAHLRGGAAAAPPSLALLRRPLSPGRRYSTPRSPLLAAAGGLPDVRLPQISPAPVPPLLRYFSSKPSKGCAPPPRRQPPTSSKGTPRLEQGCTSPPREQPPTSSEETPCLEEGEQFLIGLLEDVKKVQKQSDILNEALDNCNKSTALLRDDRWNDKNAAMYENVLEKAFKALAVYEKSLDNFSGALGSSNALSKDMLQQIQMFCKERIDTTKAIRQELNNALALFMTLKIKKKVLGVDLSTSLLILKKLNELSNFKGATAVASGMFFVLSVMIIVKFLV